MGLFSFFNRKNRFIDSSQSNGSTNTNPLTDIPENIFIEKGKTESPANEDKGSSAVDGGINILFQFLEKNHEAKGYDDALINPDSTHMEQNVYALKNELERTIRKVKTFYEDFIREIDFHIKSRSRSGMIDTVEELTVKRDTAENHIKQVMEIETQAKNNEGVGQGIVISYIRGFRNGLAAISHHNILRKNF
jgi:hypothetical protein